MKLLSIKPAYSFMLALVIIFSVFLSSGSAAAVIQSTDTVSTADLEFTDVKPAATTNSTEVAKVTDSATSKPTSIKAAGAVATKAAEKPKTLWQIFVAGLLGGFAALIMPCIYPLLPLTVSFFTKKAGSRSKGIWHSVIYGVSIIVIYVTLGLIITLIFG